MKYLFKEEPGGDGISNPRLNKCLHRAAAIDIRTKRLFIAQRIRGGTKKSYMNGLQCVCVFLKVFIFYFYFIFTEQHSPLPTPPPKKNHTHTHISFIYEQEKL